MHTIKPCQGIGRIQVVHQNLLMYVAQLHKQEEVQTESEGSEYNTPIGDEQLSDVPLSTVGPMMQIQTRAHQLAQSIQDAWTKAITILQHGQQIVDCPSHTSEHWLNVPYFIHRVQGKCLHTFHCNWGLPGGYGGRGWTVWDGPFATHFPDDWLHGTH